MGTSLVFFGLSAMMAPFNRVWAQLPGSSFPCAFGKRRGKPPKKQGFFILAETLKSLGKKGKTRKKSKEFLGKEKSREIKKARKRRSG